MSSRIDRSRSPRRDFESHNSNTTGNLQNGSDQLLEHQSEDNSPEFPSDQCSTNGLNLAEQSVPSTSSSMSSTNVPGPNGNPTGNVSNPTNNNFDMSTTNDAAVAAVQQQMWQQMMSTQQQTMTDTMGNAGNAGGGNGGNLNGAAGQNALAQQSAAWAQAAAQMSSNPQMQQWAQAFQCQNVLNYNPFSTMLTNPALAAMAGGTNMGTAMGNSLGIGGVTGQGIKGNNQPPYSEDYKKRRYKTRLCMFFIKDGSCNQGDNCTFAHSEDELPLSWKTSLCVNFEQKGICIRGENCGFAHGKGDLREYRNQVSNRAKGPSAMGNGVDGSGGSTMF